MDEASRLSLRAMGISERAARDSLRVPDFLYSPLQLFCLEDEDASNDLK